MDAIAMPDQKTKRPEFVEKFVKPVNTEIKHVGNHWYLYERSNKYDPDIKRSRKVSGACLGKITEEGLVPSKRRMVSKDAPVVASVVEVGSTLYLWNRTEKLRNRLQAHFPESWKSIYTAAILRAMKEPRLKRLQLHFEESLLSQVFPDVSFGAAANAALLKELGANRKAICDFMQDDLRANGAFILFDGHRLLSSSRTMPYAELGYDSKHRYRPQINLLYAYSLGETTGVPVYYKQFIGSTPDVTAFPDILREMAIGGKELTLVADKGFGSEEDFRLIDDLNLKYVIPLKRGNGFVKGRVPALGAYEDVFTFHGRAVQCTKFSQDGFDVYLYFDSQLFADELADSSMRLEKKNNTNAVKLEAENKRISRGKGRLSAAELAALAPVKGASIYENTPEIGTVTIRTSRTDLNGRQVYGIYKQRQAVEQFFKTYGDTMDFEASYMRDQVSQEGWLFLNHLSSMIGIGCLDEIAAIDESKNISLNDLKATLNKICACKIGATWQVAPIKKGVQKLLSKMDLSISNEDVEALLKQH